LYVQEDNRRFVSQETGNLYIAKVEPSDVGNYTCFVTNKEAQRSVQGPPTPLVQRTDGKTMSYLGTILCGSWCMGRYAELSASLLSVEPNQLWFRHNSQIWCKWDITKSRKLCNSPTWYSTHVSGYTVPSPFWQWNSLSFLCLRTSLTEKPNACVGELECMCVHVWAISKCIYLIYF
jgi:hypothetical protein